MVITLLFDLKIFLLSFRIRKKQEASIMRTRFNVSYNHLSQAMFCEYSFQAKAEEHIEMQKLLRLRPEKRWRREVKKNRRSHT
jgi:hypothetical protein